MQKTIDNSYQKLVSNIKKVIVAGQKEIERQKAITYWRIGGLINKDLLKNQKRAGYGEGLFKKLSKEIGIGVSTLNKIVQFNREFPIPSDRGKFNWSKYRALLSVDDTKKRTQIIKRANEQKWTSTRIEKEVKAINTPKEEIVNLDIEKGILGLGEVREIPKNKSVKNASLVCVDLGFKVAHFAECENEKDLKAEDLVEVGQGRVSLPAVKFRNRSARFTFVAFVKRVIDGDTLLVDIDLGLGAIVEERLRLRGIDAPELKTTEGEKVKRFVQRQLRECPFIVVQTTKGIDMYARYLADVFYSKKETNPQTVLNHGVYLNQELLDKGLVEGY